MIYPIVEGVSHGGRSVDWLRDKIFFGPDMMYLKCANPLHCLDTDYGYSVLPIQLLERCIRGSDMMSVAHASSQMLPLPTLPCSSEVAMSMIQR